MKNISLVARILLGMVFLVFGLNGFLAFIPAQPMPATAIQFVTAMSQSHYMTVVFAIELISGVLLLAGRFVPLALAMLAPVIFNIVLFHVFMAPQGLPMAAFVAILWALAAHTFRLHLSGLLRQRQLA